MRLSLNPLIELRSEAYTAIVAPAAGGRIAALTWHGKGVDVPLVVAAGAGGFEEHDWPKAGAFPMLPFANRLPSNGFRFGSRSIQPDSGPAGFAMHGFAHRKQWGIADVSCDRAVLRLVHDGRSEGWPWAFSAEQDVKLDLAAATVSVAVKNDSADPMPLGLGWHPYHPLRPGFVPTDLRFGTCARHLLDTQGSAGDAVDKGPITIGPGDTASYSGWSGVLELRMGGGVMVVTSTGASCLVVHRPVHGDYLCAEPVTILPGRLGGSREAPGVLLPGETRRISWSCSCTEDARKQSLVVAI